MEKLVFQWTDFHEIWYLLILKNMSRKFKFHYSPTRIKSTYITWRPICICGHISLNSSKNQKCYRKVYGENPITYFLFNVFFFSENRAVLEIMWKGILEPERLHLTKWRMCIASWMHKTTNKHSAYVTFLLLHYSSGLWWCPIVTLNVHCLPFYRVILSLEAPNYCI